MKENAKKQILDIFAHSNHLNSDCISDNVKSVITYSVAPFYLFLECLEPSGVSNSPDPINGLLITLATRMFKTVSGTLSLLSLGQFQQAEILSRTIMESALTLLYISQSDTKIRLVQFLTAYIDQEYEQNRKWLKELSTLDDSLKVSHEKRIQDKNKILDESMEFLKLFAQQIEADFPSKNRLPKLIDICRDLDKAIDYRTVYMAMCSQAHHDAEDILNDLIVGTSANEAILSKMLDRKTNNFSIFLALHGIRYYLECLSTIGSRYKFKSVIEQSTNSYSFITDIAYKLSLEDFMSSSLEGWVLNGT